MVDRELFDAYAEAMGANAEVVAMACRALAGMMGGVPPQEAEGALAEGYAALVRTYGDVAAAIATDFYREQRGLSGASAPYEPQAFPADNGNLLLHDVRRAMGSADAASALGSTARQRVMEYGDQTIYSNARRDPARPKWAFVPHEGACGWCRLMGSLGFSYASDRTVRNARHPHCMCGVAVDFDASSPSLEGYDPGALGDQYVEARGAVEDAARKEWAAMGADRRAEFKRSHKVGGRGGYDVFLRNRIVGYMNGRGQPRGGSGTT